MIAGRSISSSRSKSFCGELCVYVEEKVVNILHGQLEVFEPKLEWQTGLRIEFGRIDRIFS